MYTALVLSFLPLASCADESPTDFSTAPLEAAYPSPGGVNDLAITAVTASSITLTWTQVGDNRGNPARYRVKYAEPPIRWREASIACSPTIEGSAVGELISCTAEGLDPATRYDFLLMSFRLAGGAWADAKYSNVVSGTTTRIGTSVSDLSIVAATESSVTLEWTQVDDGTGSPAWYRLKYASPDMENWGSATIGCSPTIKGDDVGSPVRCTVEGLERDTKYDFQLMSFRLENGVWADATYSNVAAGGTGTASDVGEIPDSPVPDSTSTGGELPDSTGVEAPDSTATGGDTPGTPIDGGTLSKGIWISRDELMRRPTTGAAWQALLADASRSAGSADISNQDSNHDVYTLAAALVCVRIGEYCDKARGGVLGAIGTENGARWLAVGRNLAAYVIAADVLGLRADGNSGSAGTRVETWIEGWLTKRLRDNNDASEMRGFDPFGGSANAMAQEGLAYTAVAAYLGDSWALQRAWDAFRTFACDPAAPDREAIYLVKSLADGWTDALNPCAINPKGATKLVPLGLPGAGSLRRVDGALTGDMRRGGVFQWEPGFTQYPWVGLEGLVPAAVILDRAGFPAFEVADRAVLRTHEYLWYLRSETGDERWFDGSRARELVHIVNVEYGVSFPMNGVAAGGRTVGYTSWTHPGT